MDRIGRSCVQLVLKLVNFGLGMAGIAMIFYSIWMLGVWLSHQFIYTILGLGIALCVITCSGHIAAETANGCCLYVYVTFIFLFFMLEAAVTADVFLNHNWEEDFPEDQTGNLDNLKEFIQDNFDICKWIGLAVVSLQGLSILLAMILKALGPHSERYYESDDDSLPDRVPLLKNYVPEQSYVVGDPSYGVKIDTSNMRANSKEAGRKLFLGNAEHPKKCETVVNASKTSVVHVNYVPELVSPILISKCTSCKLFHLVPGFKTG